MLLTHVICFQESFLNFEVHIEQINRYFELTLNFSSVPTSSENDLYHFSCLLFERMFELIRVIS